MSLEELAAKMGCRVDQLHPNHLKGPANPRFKRLCSKGHDKLVEGMYGKKCKRCQLNKHRTPEGRLRHRAAIKRYENTPIGRERTAATARRRYLRNIEKERELARIRKANMTKEQKERARARARINSRNNRGVNYWVKQALKSR